MDKDDALHFPCRASLFILKQEKGHQGQAFRAAS